MREAKKRPEGPRPGGVVFNFLSLLIGGFCVDVITLGYVLYAAKIIGPEGFGEFSYVMAIVTISSVFMQLGIPLLVTRESAISDEIEGHRTVQSATFVTLVLGSVVVLLVSVIVALLPFLNARISYLILALVSAIFNVEILIYGAYFKGKKQMAIPEAILVLEVIVKAAIGIALLWLGFSVLSLFLAQVVSAVLTTVVMIGTYRRYFGHWPIPAAKGHSKSLLKDGGQIAAARLTSAAFNRFDWIFLGTLKTNAVLGTYAAGYRFYEILIRVPGLMAVSVFPSICQGEKRGGDNRELLRLALKMAALPGCLFLVFLYYWAENLIALTLDERFLQAVPILIVLSVSLPFQGICGILYYVAVARRRQRYLVWSSGASAGTNIILCLLFIPLWGGLGAALAMLFPVILQCFLLGLVAQISFRDLGSLIVYVLWITLVAGSEVSMIYYIIPGFWPIQVVVAALFLIPLLWFMGGLNAYEKSILSQALRRFLGRASDKTVVIDAMENDRLDL